MYIDTVFTPYEMASRGDITNKTVVVIDVLRATSTITYAFWGYRENNDIDELLGCSCVIPVETIEEAVYLSQKYNKDEVLLAGERFCLRPDGFNLGNSPCDYIPEKIRNKTIIFSTTNGTRALKLAEKAKFVTTAAFVNASSCADKVFAENNDVVILCAGRSNKTTKEDSACAGLIVKLLTRLCQENTVDYELSDAADISVKYFDYYKHDIFSLLSGAEAGRNLVEVNLERDIKDCCIIDYLSITTQYKNGVIKKPV